MKGKLSNNIYSVEQDKNNAELIYNEARSLFMALKNSIPRPDLSTGLKVPSPILSSKDKTTDTFGTKDENSHPSNLLKSKL
jgi:hypothetical protein